MGQTVRKTLRIPDKNSRSEEDELSPILLPVADVDYARKALRIPDENSRSDEDELSPILLPVADVDYARKALRIPDQNSRSDEVELSEEDLDLDLFFLTASEKGKQNTKH